MNIKTTAAIDVRNAESLVMLNNKISNCYMGERGGAVSVISSAFTDTGNVYKSNGALIGGAIYCSSCFPLTSSGSEFYDNYAYYGGALQIEGAS